MRTIPTHLTDVELIEELKRCTRDERGATATLLAHLAEMDARQLHLGLGFSSLFAYCCEVLRLSEGATYKRIEVARAARRFPVILDRLADGSLNLSTGILVVRHLTGENHQELLDAAAGLSKRAVEELVAQRFPRPDAPSLVRRLPSPPPTGPAPSLAPDAGRLAPPLAESRCGIPSTDAAEPIGSSTRLPCAPSRPVTPLSPDRYQVRFTVSAETRAKLRVAQDLLRHVVPSGDPAEIFDRALTALIEDLERKKWAARAPASRERTTTAGSRHIPAKVRRAVWTRDQGRCTFVARSGRPCRERGFLEFHHVEPYGAGGASTVANIQLRCRAHNAYESALFYGTSKALRWRASTSAEVAAPGCATQLAPGRVTAADSVTGTPGGAGIGT